MAGGDYYPGFIVSSELLLSYNNAIITMSDHRVLIVSSDLILSHDNPIITMSDHQVLLFRPHFITRESHHYHEWP